MNRFRRRKLLPWPKSQLSIARKIDTRTKAMSGSLAWVPKGPALETYETRIRADLEAILANIELPEGAPLFLKLYMIGRDEYSANPVVMVCCVNRAIRREAESSIRESRVLDRFPGFGLGSSALLLESHGLEELLTGGLQPEMSRPQSDTQSEDTLEIYGSFPHRLGGTIKFVSQMDGQIPVVRYATGGPIFQLGTELFQITAGHGMYSDTPDAKIQYSTSELDECEFDGLSEQSDDITTSTGSITPEECSTESSEEDSHSSRLSGEEASAPKAHQRVPVVADPHTTTQPEGTLPLSNAEASRSTGPFERMTLHFHNPNLDYIILKIPAPSDQSRSMSISSPKPPQRGSRNVTKTARVVGSRRLVLVVTLDGSLPGTIFPETTSYKMHGFDELQQLLTVELRGTFGPFRKGYSGSAVVDFVTGDVYGQVILGHPGQSLAYCVRTTDIFADIVRNKYLNPVLDERQWHINKQYEHVNRQYYTGQYYPGVTDISLRTSNVDVDRSQFSRQPSYGMAMSAMSPMAQRSPLYSNPYTVAASNMVVRGSGGRDLGEDTTVQGTRSNPGQDWYPPDNPPG